MNKTKIGINLWTYFIGSFFSYFLVTQKFLISASVVKFLSISVLGILYFLVEKKPSILFLVFLFFTVLGEITVINGGKAVVELMSIASILRFWSTFFLIKKNSRKNTFDRKYFLSILMVSIFALYVVVSVLFIIFEQVPYSLPLPIITAISFVFLAAYMANTFFNSQNMKNVWLLLTLILDCITFLVAPVEAMVFPSIYLQAIIHVAVVASSFFVFKFLTTKEYKMELNNKTIYI